MSSKRAILFVTGALAWVAQAQPLTGGPPALPNTDPWLAQIAACRLKLPAVPLQRSDAESVRLLGDAARLGACQESVQLAASAVSDEAAVTGAKAAVDRINSALAYK